MLRTRFLLMDDFHRRYLDFCKPFLESIKEVYSQMCQVDISYSKPMIKEGKKSYGDYSSIVGLNGVCTLDDSKRKFKGCMVLSWTEESYLKSASAILMEEFSEYNDEISDVGMEICNITMGNAKKILSEMGYQVEMSIPTSVVGKNHTLGAQDKAVTIRTPLDSEFGTFYIELSYADDER